MGDLESGVEKRGCTREMVLHLTSWGSWAAEQGVPYVPNDSYVSGTVGWPKGCIEKEQMVPMKFVLQYSLTPSWHSSHVPHADVKQPTPY